MKSSVWRQTVAAIGIVITAGLFAGCEGSSDGPDVAGADPQAVFGIVEPSSGTVVSSETITIKGIGFRDPSDMVVSVRTDRWYDQTGALHHSENNSWSYGPVYLSGTGNFNNHTIRVTAIHSDGTTETAEVSGITRN
jgi:hypothetical protein